jgi:hypothetical protein
LQHNCNKAVKYLRASGYFHLQPVACKNPVRGMKNQAVAIAGSDSEAQWPVFQAQRGYERTRFSSFNPDMRRAPTADEHAWFYR